MSLDNAFALIERHPALPSLVNYRSGMLFQCAPVKKKKTISAPPATQRSRWGLLWSQISCVEGRRSIRMRKLGVQIGNSGGMRVSSPSWHAYGLPAGTMLKSES